MNSNINNDAIVELLLKYLQNNSIDISKQPVATSPKSSSLNKKKQSELEIIYKSFKPEPIKGVTF